MYFGDSAFWGCENLEAIVIKAPLTKPDIQVFDLTNNCPIYVPDEGIERIKTIPHWPHWKNRLVPMSQMPEDLIKKCSSRGRRMLLKAASMQETNTYREPMCECDDEKKLVNGIEDINCGCHDVSCEQEERN